MEQAPLGRKVKLAIYKGQLCAQAEGIAPYVLQEAGFVYDGAWNAYRKDATPRNAYRAMKDFKGSIVYTKEVLDLALQQKKIIDERYAYKYDCNPDRMPGIVMANPWRHQNQAYSYQRLSKATLLAMEMGTGKTLVSISAMNHEDVKTVIVVCPEKVIAVWTEEVEKFSQKKFRIVDASKKKNDKVAKLLKEQVEIARLNDEPLLFVVNYDSIWRSDIGPVALSTYWDLIIFDEIQRVKAPKGKASDYCAKLAMRSKKRIGLSGTPLPNGPLDAYGVFRCLDPSIFGSSFVAFRNKYARMGGYLNKEVVGYKDMEDFQERYESITFRVTKDVLDLPPLVHLKKTCTLSKSTMDVYKAMEKEMYLELEKGEVTAANAMVKALRLQQITSGHTKTVDGSVVEFEDNAKLALLCETAEEISKEEPLVVFTVFTSDIRQIRAAIEKTGRTTGELSGQANDLKRWQDGELNTLVVQLRSGGVGVNMTRARYQFYFATGYNFGDYEQSISRCHRPGQKADSVFCIHLVAEGTIDEKVEQAMSKKEEIISSVVDYLKERWKK